MAEQYKAIGIIVMLGETTKVSDKFEKRDFFLQIEPQSEYPQEVAFQLSQKRCDLIDGYANGNEITVHFNIRGRKWDNPKTGKPQWFNTLDVWKIEGKKAYNAPEQTERHDARVKTSGPDDLPF